MIELNSVGMPIHPSKTHPLTGEPIEALYVTKAGKICWPIMGAAEDDGGDDQGGDDGGDDGADDGAGGLLDDEADNGGDDGGDDGSDDGSGGVDVDEIVAQVTKALEAKFDSIADRRVNAIVKEVRKQQKPAGEEDKKDDSEKSSGPSDADVREARLAYREYVGDSGVKFLGDVERNHAMTLAKGMIPGLLAQGLDPDEAGRKAADDVASTIKSLRKHYESKTLAALKRQGQIADDTSGTGQAVRTGTGKPGADSMLKKGQSKAAEMFADRIAAAE